MPISVKKCPRGSYRLVHDKRGPVEDVNRFLSAVEVRGLTPATLRAYAFDLLALYRWLASSRRVLRRLRPRDLLEFVAEQRASGAQPTTINRRLTTCRLLYRFLTDRDLDGARGGWGPAPFYRGRGKDRNLGLHSRTRQRRLALRVKTPRRIVEPLTVSQVRQFLRTLRRYRDVAVVHLMLLCGLRSKEVLTLELSDIALADRQFRVRGKGQKERMLPLPDLLTRSLGDYLRWERPAHAPTERVFVVLQGARRGQAMTFAGLRSLFRHRRKDRDIARANPHRFRHTFGADMARAGVRLPVLQRIMGHEHGVTTLKYIHLSMADVADAYEQAIREIEKRYPRE